MLTNKKPKWSYIEHLNTIRHSPLDILGGAWDLCLGRKFFFGQYPSEQGYFFRRPFGPDNFFHN